VPQELRARLAPPGVERASAVPPPAATDRAGTYARAALDREAATVRAAAPGTCNHTLNRAAFNLGQLIAARLLDAAEVSAVLLEAAMAAPTSGHADRERKARQTIKSGLRAGARTPRRGRGVA
jgi:hypothetical protein